MGHAADARGPGRVRQALLGEGGSGQPGCTARAAAQPRGASEREGLEEVPTPQLGFGSAPLGHAGQLAGAATGVGGLAARAPWRPPVSHWPALPIKTATGAPRPFQHLPALDSARRSPVDFAVFCRTWRRERRASGWERKREPSRSLSLPPLALFLPPPRNPSSPPPARGGDVAEIHFGARRCLGQEASRGQRGLGQNEIL